MNRPSEGTNKLEPGRLILKLHKVCHNQQIDEAMANVPDYVWFVYFDILILHVSPDPLPSKTLKSAELE
jgi:hypothetical protein